ncbi:MYND-type zinc finger protein samB [Colletotrichum orbiculare MAFF 240422]|uniref:MYND-type zinc finger protein samB n=1 Tax=Colletotrichum orbiculare (strain 104-T / ATCC 96160 / CBS 514.97 / LARS 414 / MAFF 240422) TaxID=1213857 RepID=A0A484FZY9_COLOR|nr:MYND-type zinc finger protein samB [Colletotrichum orbiculare MAFF 240422]
MREVNFSIPNVNKASVGITTALYDRRALDCTSTLPLINSLNHLAYLTTSSARIRDILTVDGGIERLICILKHGRSKDMMDMWKWNLAFQCVVNIGVRGTENVRTRVVEADMVPVIATILENYIRVTEKCRDKSDDKAKDNHHRHRTHDHRSVHKAPSFTNRPNRVEDDQRSSRRQAPPPPLTSPRPMPALRRALWRTSKVPKRTPHRPNILRWLLPTGLQFQPIATTTTTNTTTTIIIIITGQLRFVTRCLLLPVKLSSLSPQRYDLLMPPTVSCDLFVMSTALPR